jgi:hypothetical protein
MFCKGVFIYVCQCQLDVPSFFALLISVWLSLVFSDQRRTCVQICAREVLGRQRLKATVKQPPVIDPRTGQEVIIEPEGPSSQDSDDSDDSTVDSSDIEAEYFEAEMELGNQNVEQFGTRHIPGTDTVITQPSDVPDSMCYT